MPEAGWYAARTLRELLSHTGGMQSEPAGPWWERHPGGPVAELLAANDGSGAVFGPGEHHHYSNLGYGLLGEVLARVHGRPWWTLVEERVLRPLGMRRTSYAPAADAVAGAYLLGWALRRERRDKAAVLTVGVMLELCALALLVIAAGLETYAVP